MLVSTVLLPAAVSAQSPAPSQTGAASVASNAIDVLPGVQISGDGGTVRLQFQGGIQAASMAEVPLTAYGGYLLPMQTFLVEAVGNVPDGGMAAMASVQQADSSPFTGELLVAPQLDPPALDWDPDPAQRPVFEQSLPSAPFFLLREGMERNRRLAVFAFSGIYQDPNTGEIRQVESFDAQVSGVGVVSQPDATASPENVELFAPVAALAGAPGPSNPYANSAAVKFYVNQTGMQQVTGDTDRRSRPEWSGDSDPAPLLPRRRSSFACY